MPYICFQVYLDSYDANPWSYLRRTCQMTKVDALSPDSALNGFSNENTYHSNERAQSATITP